MKPVLSIGLGVGALVGIAALVPAPRAATHPVPKRKHVTFAGDVAPILYGKCASCHHTGEVAPFSLMSYEDAKSKSKTIAAVADSKFMPPWQAVTHTQFSNDRSLTAAQIETLKAWSDEGAPAGDLTRAPKPPKFTSDWHIGKPDFVGTPAKAYNVPAEGADEYRCFVVPTSFSEDRYVTDVELRPGSRKVVHHIIVYVDTSGVARKKDGKDGKPGYVSFGGPGIEPAGTLGGWAPGLQPMSVPIGSGMWLPKGADLVLQVHYHKDGKPETDLSSVAMKFATAPVDKKVRWESIGSVFMNLAPGEKRSEVTADTVLATPLTLLDVIPHMHLLGHDMRVTATLPDGSKRELISVDNYDFNWQTRYIYRQPIRLPKGTHLALVAHYDNSTDNLHNPNSPPKTVHCGEQTTDEMCYAFFSFTMDDEHLLKHKKLGDSIGVPDVSDTFSKMFAKFDAGQKGWLDESDVTRFADEFRPFAAEMGGAANYNPGNLAKYLLNSYGKAVKRRLSKLEFVKMALQFSN